MQQLTLTTSKKSNFNFNPCKVMLVANISLNKLANPQFKGFLAIYTGQNISAEPILRIGYIDKCYIKIINKIKKLVNGKKIWILINETIDIEGRNIVNTIIGILLRYRPGEIFLINIK